MREIRRRKVDGMREFVEHLVNVFGGADVLSQKIWQAYADGSPGYRRRVLQTILAMVHELDKERVLQKELLIEKLRQGMASADDVAEAREELSEKQLLDAACDAVGTLVESGLLGEVLQRLKERGRLAGEELEAVRRAVA